MVSSRSDNEFLSREKEVTAKRVRNESEKAQKKLKLARKRYAARARASVHDDEK